MNDGALVRKNLFRKPLRSTLLIITIFIAFLLFGGLGSFLYFFNYAENPNSANRLITVNKINFTQPLPEAYLERIRRIEGVIQATPMQWFGGYYQEPINQVQTFPIEPETFLEVYGDDIELTDAQREAFLNNRIGMIMGRAIADRIGVAEGDHIPMHSDIYTNGSTGQQVWEFDVVALYDGPNPGAYFNREYFRESATFGGNMLGWVVMTTESSDINDAVAQRIDTTFQNSPYETRTQDETAFGRAFLAQMGDLNFIISLVVGAAFAAILMVVGNTMMMAIRERTQEIGVMKTLGFSSRRVVNMVIGESLLLSLIGAALGLGLAAFALWGLGAAQPENFPGMAMPWQVAAIGVSVALVFGLITGLAPALNAFNLKIVEALGRK
jgi:putative ABC transport system permease protein